MTNKYKDKLAKLANQCVGFNRDGEPDYFIGTFNLTAFAELIAGLEAAPPADKDAERFRFLIDMFLSRSSDDEIEHWEYSKCKLIFICDDTEDNLALSLRKHLDEAMGEV